MARHFSTVIEFINYGKVNANAFGNGIIEFEGFNSIGDGGASRWQRTGVTGLTPSKTPADFNANKFTDSVGDEWELMSSQIITFSGVQFLPFPFGGFGDGGYYYDGDSFVYLADASEAAQEAAEAAAEAAAAAQRAEDAASSVEGQLTTTQLIASGLTVDVGDTVETNGFYTAGDGGGALWLKTENTNTPNQTPSDMGDATLADALGSVWSFTGKALFIEQLGGVLDGSDNTSVLIACAAWSNSKKSNVYVGIGTIVTKSMSFVSDTFFSLVGLDRYKSVIKLKQGENTHLIPLSGTSEFKAKSITLDQNSNDGVDQSGGHVIRSGGCNMFHLDNVLIRNGYSYGIGMQGGTSKGVKWRDIECEDLGQDCIDIKDYNLNNDVIDLIGFTGRRFGTRELQQSAIDVRGPANMSNLTIEIDGESQAKVALRLRVSSSQGRGGSGVFSNIKITDTSVVPTSRALDIASDTDDFVISNVECKNVAFAIVQSSDSVGGQISNLTSKGMTGSDCIKFQGNGLLVSGVKADNKPSSSRIYDFTPTATGNRLTNFILKDNSGSAAAGRIQSGATDNAVTNGSLYGGNAGDGGTNTDLNGLKIL